MKLEKNYFGKVIKAIILASDASYIWNAYEAINNPITYVGTIYPNDSLAN